MTMRTYHGSCHCKAVRYEADFDLATGTGKCNCTYCWKVRNWTVRLEPAQFRLLTGEDALGSYGFRPESKNHHGFCKTCGVRVCTRGDIPETGGAYVSIAVATLDDLAPEDLVAAPVRYMDGRHDNWFEAPKQTSHL